MKDSAEYLKTYAYSLQANTIWLSFDYGEVQANTIEEALELAKTQLKYDIDKANEVLAHADVTQGFNISVDFSQLVVTLKAN